MTAVPVAVVAHREKLDPTLGEALREALTAEGLDVQWYDIGKGRAATKAARRAMKAGAQHVVVAGGDGTVRAAIEAVAGTGVPLAVVPAGTANLFATGLGLPSDPLAIARAVRQRSTRVLDTGRCNGHTFAVMAGTGLDAGMIDFADRDKERLGMVAYLRAGVREARHREPFRVKVKVDGTTLVDDRASCVLVGNLGTLKGGLEAFPAARPDDGLLDVAVISASGVGQWAGLLWTAVRGKPGASSHVCFAQGRRIDVSLKREHRYELDGGSVRKDDRLKFRVQPASLHVTIAAD